MNDTVDVKPPKAPQPGYYRQEDGRVAIVRTSKRGNWYAIAVRRRPDFSLEREYLGHRTKGLHSGNMLTTEQATDALCGVA